MKSKRDIILEQAKKKFPGKVIRLRAIGGDWELLVGKEGEECFAVEELEDGTFDFEQRD